jgi:hypothetical protein
MAYTCKEQASAKKADHIEIVNGIRMDFTLNQVKEKCKDLKRWFSSKTYFGSKKCGFNFTKLKKYSQNRNMSFKFEGEKSKLVEVEFYEAHPTIQSHNRRRSHYLKMYKKRYGEPREKYCSYRHANKVNKCVEYFWKIGQTELMLHLAEEPSQELFGIYFVWRKINAKN